MSQAFPIGYWSRPNTFVVKDVGYFDDSISVDRGNPSDFVRCYIADTLTLTKPTRVRKKYLDFELLLGTESLAVNKRIGVTEHSEITDVLDYEPASRIKELETLTEYLEGTEEITIRHTEIYEYAFVRDQITAYVTQRVRTKQLLELLLGTATGTVPQQSKKSASEVSYLSDSLALTKIPRLRIKNLPSEFVFGTSSVGLTKVTRTLVDNLGLLKEVISRTKLSRTKVKALTEFISGVESITPRTSQSFVVSDSGLVLDSITVSKFVNFVIKALKEYLASTETVSLSMAAPLAAALNATPVDATTINLNWSQNPRNTSYQRLFWEGNLLGPSFARGSGSYQHTGRTPGVANHYQIISYGPTGLSTGSNVATATTQWPTPTGNFTAISATPSTINTSVHLAWTFVGSNYDGFKIERNLNYTGFVNYTTVGLVGSIDDNSLSEGDSVSYRVTATNHGVVGPNAISNTAVARIVPPPTPINLRITQVTGSSIKVEWDSGGDPQPYRYKVLWDISNFVFVSNITPWYTASGFLPNSTHTFKVWAIRYVNGNEVYSTNYATVTGTTLAQKVSPPYNIFVIDRSINYGDTVRYIGELHWTLGDVNASSTIQYKSVFSGTWLDWGSVGIGVQMFTGYLPAAGDYDFRVQCSRSGFLDSDWAYGTGTINEP